MSEKYIIFNAPISPQSADGLTSALTEAVNEGVATVHLQFSTLGGQVRDGLTLYNFIRSLPMEVFIYNMGKVDSVGNVIFQAGRRRITATNSSFMFHGVGFDIQNERLERADLIEKLEALNNDQSQISAIMAARTQLSRNEIDGLFKRMAFLDASEALERGIVDEVTDIRIKSGIPVRTLVFG